MASGTKSKGANKPKSKGAGGRSGRRSIVATASKPKPWGMIIAIIAIVALAGGVFTYAFSQIADKEQWIVSEDNQDPSTNINGVKRVTYEGSRHVTTEQRVAYDQSPPFGGPHDQAWAECSGTVYANPVRTESMVHSLEHGAVWIAYNPDKIKGGQLDKLTNKVQGQPYLMLSPYPGLDQPISMQSWGHQLKLSNPDDTRVDNFIKSLRENQYQNPEPGGRCDAEGTGFDVTNPPPFVAEKPGADAVTMDGKGAIDESQSEQGGAPPTGAVPPAGETPPPAGETPPPSQ